MANIHLIEGGRSPRRVDPAGSGGDDDGGMNARLAKLEMEVAEIKGKISQLPTTWQMVSVVGGLFLASAGGTFALIWNMSSRLADIQQTLGLIQGVLGK